MLRTPIKHHAHCAPRSVLIMPLLPIGDKVFFKKFIMRFLAGLILLAGLTVARADDARHSAAHAAPTTDRNESIVISRSTCDWCQWIAETPNFRIYWCPATGNVRRFASKCERLAAVSQEWWLGQDAERAWTPKCDVVVHRGVTEYVACLGNGSEATSGSATIRLDEGRVVLHGLTCGSMRPTGFPRACRTN